MCIKISSRPQVSDVFPAEEIKHVTLSKLQYRCQSEPMIQYVLIGYHLALKRPGGQGRIIPLCHPNVWRPVNRPVGYCGRDVPYLS